MPLTQIKDGVIQNLNANKVTGAFTTSADGSQLTGLSAVDWDLRYNLAINYFNDSVRENFDRSGLDQGWVDVFKDTDDVDGEGVSVPMTKFDGVNDYLNHPGSLGGSDSDKVAMSFWIKPKNDGTGRYILAQNLVGTGHVFYLVLSSANKLFMVGLGTGGAVRIQTSGTTTLTEGNIYHVLVDIDLGNSIAQFYINDVADGMNDTSKTTGDILFSGDWKVGDLANVVTGDKMDGSLGALWFNSGTRIDFSQPVNRRLFIDANGKPVDLGPNGEKPLGTTPLIYLNNPYGSFQTNLGTGGNFSVTGELVDGGYVNDKTYDSSTDSFSNSYELIESNGKENWHGDTQVAQEGQWQQGGVGQCFTLSSTQVIEKVGLSVLRVGTPTGLTHCEIMGATGTVGTDALPDNNLLGISNPVNVTTISNSAREITIFNFSEPIVLPAGDYYVGLRYDDSSSTGPNRLQVGYTGPTSFHSGNYVKDLYSGGWTVTSGLDAIFYLYGQKNLDLITKGSDDIGNSPSTAPTKGHMEVLMTGHNTITAKDYSPDTEDHGYTNTSLRVRYTATSNATRIRLKLKGSITRSNTNIRNISIGEEASNFNCKTTPTEIFTGGSSGMFVYTGKYGITDWFDFDISKGTSYLITFDLEADASNDDVSMNNSTGDGAVAQNVTGSNSGVTYNVATFGTRHATENTGKVWCLDSVETLDIATLDTDIIGQISRNGGGSDASNWTDIPLKRIKTQVGGSSNNLLVGNAALTSTTGTNIVGRIKTANKDKITVQGISVNWS